METMVAANRNAYDWRKVREALGDSRWDFRTVGGISRQTGLDRNRVMELLEQQRPEVRQTISRKREPLYTLASRPMKMREIMADLQRFASNSL